MNDKLRKARGKHSQEEIATAVGITKGYYSLIERGERRVSYELAYRIANVLNTTPDAIFLDFQSAKSKKEAVK